MGRPKKLSVLDRILALAETPEPEKVPPDYYGRRRERDGRQTNRIRLGTRAQIARRKARMAARPKKAFAGVPRPVVVQGGRGRLRGNDYPLGERAQDRIHRLMEPGRWYAGGDLVRAAGIATGQSSVYLGTMEERGLVVRAQNDRWPGKQIGVGRTWRVREPKWLYRLTGLGEEVLRMLVCVGV